MGCPGSSPGGNSSYSDFLVQPLLAEDLNHVLRHTQHLWEEARGQRFFVTGGTGFFGKWLLETFCYVNACLKLEMQATVLTRDSASFAKTCPHIAEREDVSFLDGDVRGFDFPLGQYRFIVHAATEASRKWSHSSQTEELSVLIDGTRRVLDFAERCGARKLLLSSSGAIYGVQPPEISHISEDYLGAPDTLLPESTYGEGKRVAEHLCVVHSANRGYDVKIARCFAFVGPHLPLNGHFAMGNFLRDVLSGGAVRIAGDGTAVRSYLYAADLAVWLWTVLFRGSHCRAYNVGSDESVSITQVARAVIHATGEDLPVDIAGEAEQSLGFSRYVPSIERAKRELNLSIWVPLDDAISRTLAWLRRML